MHRNNRRIVISLSVLLALLLGARISLPYAAQWYINRTLSQPGNYDGRVGDVDIMLWRGAYQLEHVLLYKANGEVERPLFRANSVEFTLIWSQLFKGAAVGSVHLIDPEINFVDGADESKDQVGKDEDWLNIANQLFPLRIDALTINQGKITFYNPQTSPAIDISLHQINGTLSNLVNSDALSDNRIAIGSATAQTADQGSVKVDASLNPTTAKPTFDIDLEANNVALVNFKHLLDTYAPFDLEAGTLTLAAELAADNGKVKGYVKPILHNVEVFSWEGDIEEDGDGPIEGSIELVSAFVTELFENQRKDQVATRIPLEGNLANPDASMWSALGALFKNAFVKAFSGDVEDSVELDMLPSKKQASASTSTPQNQ